MSTVYDGGWSYHLTTDDDTTVEVQCPRGHVHDERISVHDAAEYREETSGAFDLRAYVDDLCENWLDAGVTGCALCDAS